MKFKTALTEIVKKPQTFTLFTAPMGWGKTRYIWELLESEKKLILFSPLRSVADELTQRDFVVACERSSFDSSLKRFISMDKAILVTTVESFPWEYLEYLLEKTDPICVLDEFHLFYEWGQSFRPKLYESYRLLLQTGVRILGLSATIEKEHLNELEVDIRLSGHSSFFVNIGNFQLQRDPKNVIRISSDQLINQKLLFYCHTFKEGRLLVFVRTREQGRSLKRFLLGRGISCSLCLGGEVSDFMKNEYIEKKRVVISTSALSHGVNLENIRRVFLTYEPTKYLKSQMIGRGGRFGESFNVYMLANKSGRFSVLNNLKEKIQLLYYQFLNQSIGLWIC